MWRARGSRNARGKGEVPRMCSRTSTRASSTSEDVTSSRFAANSEAISAASPAAEIASTRRCCSSHRSTAAHFLDATIGSRVGRSEDEELGPIRTQAQLLLDRDADVGVEADT